jgi:hypothetical protein
VREEVFHTAINMAVTLVCFSKQPVWGRRHLQPTETVEARRDQTTELDEDRTVVSYKQNGIRDNIFTIGTFDIPYHLQESAE